MRQGCHGWADTIRRTPILVLALIGWLQAPHAHAAQQEALDSCRSMVEPELRHAGKAAVGLEIDDKKMLLETVKGAIGDQAVTAVLSAPGDIQRSGEPDTEIRLICLVGPGDTALFAHLVRTGAGLVARGLLLALVGAARHRTLPRGRPEDGRAGDGRAASRRRARMPPIWTRSRGGRTRQPRSRRASGRGSRTATRNATGARRWSPAAPGEGDIGLACRVDLTNARAAELRP